MGPAWFDYPSATDTAHALAVCSNAGVCDTTTGTCTCQAGFEGECSGGGRGGWLVGVRCAVRV
jgi:hypothetical protein